MPRDKFITYPELPDYGVPKYSRKHLGDLMRRGQFPAAFQLSANRIGWSENSIRAWVATRPIAASLTRVRQSADGAEAAD